MDGGAATGRCSGRRPAVQVSAAPAAPSAAPRPVVKRARQAARLRDAGTSAWRSVAAVFALIAAVLTAPSFLGHFTVFVLAVIIGYYVIGNVAPLAAHAADGGDERDLAASSWSARCCRSADVHSPSRDPRPRGHRHVVASINVFGGFLVPAA